MGMKELTKPLDIPAGQDSGWKKYGDGYDLEVDPDQDDKAREIRLCSTSRPHMRGFHCSWFSFFIAFFIWFAISPLLGEIRTDLGLTTKQIWTSSIVGVGSTIGVRFLLGPLCDKYGARVLFSAVLCFAAIPTACTGLIQNATQLYILRALIGVAGGSFVMCQYWTSVMFAREVVGTANALAGGWGNLGAGVTQLVMGSFLFPLFKGIFEAEENPAESAWRTVCIIPAIIAFTTGVTVYFISDDSPKGNYAELRKTGSMPQVSGVNSLMVGSLNANTWILFVQYACCFGVELTMYTASALYFKDHFGLSTETAAAMASIFGWMNLFARGLGGFISDVVNYKSGMKGRIITHTIILALEGILVLIFANTESLGAAIIVLVFFSLFVQAAEGTSYAIVPYVDPPNTGSVSGIVGAGGNVGAVCFGLGFRELDYNQAFLSMGLSILASCVLSFFLVIRGHAGIVFGEEAERFKDDYDSEDDEEE